MQGTQNSDGALVELALSGDITAANTLFRRYAGPLLGLVKRMIGRSQDAEDILQEAFTRALEDLSSLRDRNAFGSWLRAVVVHQTHRYFRRRKLLRFIGLDRGIDNATLVSLADSGCSPEQRAELAALDRVLADLPAEQRIAWCLRYIEGEQLEDIATACGCSLATAKRRISVAHTRVLQYVNIEEGVR